MHSTTASWLRVGAGVIAANVLGLTCCLAYWGLFLITRSEGNPSKLLLLTVYPNLLLVPMAMGIAAAHFWHPLGLRIWEYLLWSFVAVLVSIAAAYVALKEGVICLVIVSPVMLVALFAGSLVGRLWFQRARNNLQLTIFPLLILAVLAEGRIANEREGVVTDWITIAAAPAEVWRHVVAFPRITRAPDYWLNKAGLPCAAQTTCEGAFVGAKRECIFSNGLVFKEVVAELEPSRLLTFDVVEQPTDPELLGHVALHRGQFELQSNGDGTTTLIGRSWYTLHVRPLWYFDWWTRDITRHVHLRVMQHIKELSEPAP